MLALILAATLAQAPEVAPPADPPVPVEEQVAANRFMDVRRLPAGVPMPADGVWMDVESALVVAQAHRACELDRAKFSEAPPGWLPWVVGAVAVIAGGVGGYQLHRLTKRAP